jgi:hypothetical protein
LIQQTRIHDEGRTQERDSLQESVRFPTLHSKDVCTLASLIIDSLRYAKQWYHPIQSHLVTHESTPLSVLQHTVPRSSRSQSLHTSVHNFMGPITQPFLALNIHQPSLPTLPHPLSSNATLPTVLTLHNAIKHHPIRRLSTHRLTGTATSKPSSVTTSVIPDTISVLPTSI